MFIHIAFIIIQAGSLLTMVLFIHEYKRISHQHEQMIIAIEHGKTPSCKQQSTVIIWIYVTVTFTLFFATTALYLTLPNL